MQEIPKPLSFFLLSIDHLTKPKTEDQELLAKTMDPCPFVRLMVESLAIKLPLATKPAGSGVHPSTTPCFCKIRIKNFPSQTALLPLCSNPNDSPPDTTTSAAGFHLDAAALRRLSGKPITLRVSVYTGRMGRTCGVSSGKLLGRVQVSVDLGNAESKPVQYQNGWLKLGSHADKPTARLHLVVRSEPDPRFVFQFGGEPECSPVVFQIQGNNIRQPVFSCKFSADRNARSRSLPTDFNASNNRSGLWRTFSGEKERTGRERKGWMVMIYDLSGSPVAAASMITPFVPSPGSDRVSRSNPGAWLILRPNGFSVSSWKPWGRLEAWRERGPIDGLGYKFELVTDSGPNSGIPIAEATMSVKKGGQFCIDRRIMRDSTLNLRSPVKGFVMGSTVEGEGKVSKPMVQVGMQHVTCMADAALKTKNKIKISIPQSMAFAQTLFLLFTLISSTISTQVIQLPSAKHTTDGGGQDNLYCDSWRFSVETNDAGSWTTVPSRCLSYVKGYVTGEHYVSDSEVVAANSLDFAKTVKLAGDGKDAWVFDIDETLLSNLPYYAVHGYGSEAFDEVAFDEWVESAKAPAIPASLNLYKELKQMGFAIFLLTGRGEYQRNCTSRNLLFAGFSDWERLILRGPSDQGKPATLYKSEKRAELIDGGYRIHGSSGDQWSDLLGLAVAERSFKLPNPMYYIA
ncbi:hypothetical protein Tsubulata_019803 [Turnera subulata]|uniref:Acid phosphatase n=1 Tax=Turnera subulata TaxID=218843 RepID=A0A9Q0FJP8_9ROSI|nr:hypothetical protein Tsubulata_019803 [Turnera subulata]